MALQSREYNTPKDFVEDFLRTMKPGIIPRSEFVDWAAVDRKMSASAESLAFYADLGSTSRSRHDLLQEMADSLLACDNPMPYLKCGFELLGHMPDQFVSYEDDIELKDLSRAIEGGDESQALHFSELMSGLGMRRILSSHDVAAVFLGVQLGLETHVRKNRGGKCFQQELKPVLANIAAELAHRTSSDIRLSDEVTIPYGNGLSKRVDFAIEVDRAARFGIEANFYTVAGSKPTEIKRSYGAVQRRLTEIGIELIWITDGKGYTKMQRSLADAYRIVPNIYNLHMVNHHLVTDLLAAISAIL